MTVKRLFDDNDMYNDDSREFCAEVQDVLKPLISRWVEKGFSTRDIAFIIQEDVSSFCMEERIRMTVEKRKKEREEKYG